MKYFKTVVPANLYLIRPLFFQPFSKKVFSFLQKLTVTGMNQERIRKEIDDLSAFIEMAANTNSLVLSQNIHI